MEGEGADQADGDRRIRGTGAVPDRWDKTGCTDGSVRPRCDTVPDHFRGNLVFQHALQLCAELPGAAVGRDSQMSEDRSVTAVSKRRGAEAGA